MNQPPARGEGGARSLWGRRPADFVLFGVTVVELTLLVVLSPGFGVTDWIYVCSNLLVLGLALTRRPAEVQDRSIGDAGVAVVVSYTYSYAQVALLNWYPGEEACEPGGLVLVIVGASMSLMGLVSLGRSFGVRPAMRGLATRGMYRLVRHPLYLAYAVQDVGYNLNEWNVGTLALVAMGWASMIYRIMAEERVLATNPEWAKYASRVRYRLLPGVW